ncbi:uncharacterized protein ACNS7B_002099 [Menidia menidia]
MSLILILMLHFTAAATGQSYPRFLVKAGYEVSLPCKTETNYQQNCGQFSWLFASKTNSQTKTLFEYGKIQPKSDRLTVTEDCSLLIKEVTDLDVGHYTCREFESGRQVSQSGVFLSVVHMTEHQNKDWVTLFCSVLEHRSCEHSVEWLQEDGDKMSSDERTQSYSCSAALTFPTSDLNQKSDVFRCKVTNVITKEEKLFPFSLSPQAKKRNISIFTDEFTTTSPSTVTETRGWSWWFVLLPVVLAALSTTVVVFIVWRRTKAENNGDQNVATLPVMGNNPTITTRIGNGREMEKSRVSQNTE